VSTDFIILKKKSPTLAVLHLSQFQPKHVVPTGKSKHDIGHRWTSGLVRFQKHNVGHYFSALVRNLMKVGNLTKHYYFYTKKKNENKLGW